MWVENWPGPKKDWAGTPRRGWHVVERAFGEERMKEWKNAVKQIAVGKGMHFCVLGWKASVGSKRTRREFLQ